eukprot:3383939-Pyramimonas_sp.AAC.1
MYELPCACPGALAVALRAVRACPQMWIRSLGSAFCLTSRRRLPPAGAWEARCVCACPRVLRSCLCLRVRGVMWARA